MSPTFFSTQNDFRKWLAKYHKTSSELIVGYYKLKSGQPSMTWSQSVDQALCFGWIDGVRKSVDESSYCIRFTPRKKNSIWSSININKVEDLTKKGLMTEDGLKAYGYRTEEKSRIYAFEKETVLLSKSYEHLFKSNKLAWNFFEKQAPSYKKVMIHWIMAAKRENTQIARLNKAIKESELQRKMR